MVKYIAIISFFVFIIALNQCGFTLRSNEIISSRFNSIHLNLQQPNSELSRLLRRRLDIAGVETQLLTANLPNFDQPVLVISDEQITSRPVTFNSRARTAQQEMRLSITILFEQGEQMLIRPETLFIERTYLEDVENIAGSQEEVVIIRAEMRGELVNQIMRRLEAASN